MVLLMEMIYIKGKRALNKPEPPSPKLAELIELELKNLFIKHKDKRTCQKQGHAKASEEASAKAPEETQAEKFAEASQNLKPIDRPSCNYFKAYELDAQQCK